MSSHRRTPLEKNFAVLVIPLGMLLIFLGFLLIKNSNQILLRQYFAAARTYTNTYLLLSERPGSAILSTTVRSVDEPVTDPPWMNRTVRVVKRYVSEKPHPFLEKNVIENPNVCRNTSVDLLIVIHSAVNNFQRRRILRETWAASDTIRGMSVKRIFALGRPPAAEKAVQLLVNTEHATFEDVVQGNFVDAISNLTRKAVMALRWVNDYCTHARFVLKVDDDVFVNVFSLAQTFLQRLAGRQRSVMCHVIPANKLLIIRQSSSKWYVPANVLPNSTHWPTFCSGYLVVMTTDVVPALYEMSTKVPYCPVDDSYVYGVLPATNGGSYLAYIDIVNNLTLSGKDMLTSYQNMKNKVVSYMAGAADDDESMITLWHAVNARLSPWARHRSAIASSLFGNKT